MNRPPIVAALVGALFLSACAACGRTEPPALDGGIADSGTDGGRRDGGIVDLDSGPRDAEAPTGCDEGWMPVRGLPTSCSICAWTPAATPVAPLVWPQVAVPNTASPSTCEHIASPSGAPLAWGIARSAEGETTVAASEVGFGVGRRTVTQRADGRVVSAFDFPPLAGTGVGCGPHGSFASSRLASVGFGELANGTSFLSVGMAVAPLLELGGAKTVGLVDRDAGLAEEFFLFGGGPVRASLGASSLIDVEDPTKTYPLYDAAPYGGDIGLPQDDLPGGFVGTPTNKGLYWVGSKATGPVLKFDGRRYADGSQVLGIGSDGTDLVWTRGFGGTPRINEREHAELWRAPYNDPDPFAHGSRVLTSDVELGAKSKVVVGCGYAASRLRFGYDGVHPVRAGLVLVRLSDGRRWRFEDDAAQTGSVTDWQYMNPAALDCTHLYVTVDARLEADRAIRETIARFKIADLGPGIAP